MRRRYIQHPITLKLIPAEEYVRPTRAHAIHGDLEPFRSTVDGSLIASRRDLREHNRRLGVVTEAELGNEGEAARKAREDMYAGRPFDRERRLDAMRFAFEVESRDDLTRAEKRQMAENYREDN